MTISADSRKVFLGPMKINKIFGMVDGLNPYDFITALEIRDQKNKYPNAWKLWQELNESNIILKENFEKKYPRKEDDLSDQSEISIENRRDAEDAHSGPIIEKYLEEIHIFSPYADIIQNYEDLPFMVGDEGKPKRHYHDATHLEYLAIEYFKIEHLIPEEDKEAFILALFFHDYVYEGRPEGADEKASFESLKEANKLLGFSEKTINRAEEFILATYDTKRTLTDPIIALFVDMDRSILGAEAELYAHYLDGVRKEFCGFYNLTKDQFLIARAEKFTEPLLESEEKIFKSDHYSALEKQARENLFREVVNAYALKTNPEPRDFLTAPS